MSTPIADPAACKKYNFTRGWLFKQEKLDPDLPVKFQIAGKNHRFEEDWQRYFARLKRKAQEQRLAEAGEPPRRGRGRPRKIPTSVAAE